MAVSGTLAVGILLALGVCGMMYTSSIHSLHGNNKDWKMGSVQSENGRFMMTWNEVRLPPALDSIAKWKLKFGSPAFPTPEESTQMFPVVKPDWSLVTNTFDELSITWVGHATCYVKMAGGLRILTDPVFSHRITPFPWFSPTRYVPVPFELEEMPMPHYILISHDHYDHLDSPSILKIEEILESRKPAVKPHYLVGLGLSSFMQAEYGIPADRITEFDWWQELPLQFTNDSGKALDITAKFLPTQHWSGRVGDNMQRLWGSFLITDSAAQTFYFVGDTGWDQELFEEISSRLPDHIDLAAIPIGAYKPRWFMRPQHIDPKEACRIHGLLRSKFSIRIHWGTFILTDEPVLEPKEKLEVIRADVDDGTLFVSPVHGQTLAIV